jgi:hypothetical protein
MTRLASLFRVVVALLGLLSLPSVWQHWFAIDSIGRTRGLTTVGTIGAANLRADVGGIFLAIGLFMLIAAWTQKRIWLIAAMIAVASALLGRFVSLFIDGASDRVAAPIIVEAVVVCVLVGAWLSWRPAVKD